MDQKPQSHISTHFKKYSLSASEEIQSEIALEAPVTLTVNGEEWLSFLCTPIDLEFLAIGFLFNEGFIHSASEIESVRVCVTFDNVDVWLKHAAQKPRAWRRTSGCGNGMSPADPSDGMLSPLEDGIQFRVEQVYAAMEEFIKYQRLHREGGGTHASALFDGERITAAFEDLGRHNTLDKLAGYCLQNHVSMQNQAVITSGRISSDMARKAVRMGTSIVISLNSTNGLSIEIANQYRLTLIGHARNAQFNVYTHFERIIES
jgi:FdhD protein